MGLQYDLDLRLYANTGDTINSLDRTADAVENIGSNASTMQTTVTNAFDVIKSKAGGIKDALEGVGELMADGFDFDSLAKVSKGIMDIILPGSGQIAEGVVKFVGSLVDTINKEAETLSEEDLEKVTNMLDSVTSYGDRAKEIIAEKLYTKLGEELSGFFTYVNSGDASTAESAMSGMIENLETLTSLINGTADDSLSEEDIANYKTMLETLNGLGITVEAGMSYDETLTKILEAGAKGEITPEQMAEILGIPAETAVELAINFTTGKQAESNLDYALQQAGFTLGVDGLYEMADGIQYRLALATSAEDVATACNAILEQSEASILSVATQLKFTGEAGMSAIMASYLNGEISLDDMVAQYTEFYKLQYKASQIAEKQAEAMVELETQTQNLVTATDKATYEYLDENEFGERHWRNKSTGAIYTEAELVNNGYTYNPEDQTYFNKYEEDYANTLIKINEADRDLKELSVELAQLYDEYGYTVDENGNLVPLETVEEEVGEAVEQEFAKEEAKDETPSGESNDPVSVTIEKDNTETETEPEQSSGWMAGFAEGALEHDADAVIANVMSSLGIEGVFEQLPKIVQDMITKQLEYALALDEGTDKFGDRVNEVLTDYLEGLFDQYNPDGFSDSVVADESVTYEGEVDQSTNKNVGTYAGATIYNQTIYATYYDTATY